MSSNPTHRFTYSNGNHTGINSPRRPQFTSRVWQAFCNQLDIIVSLISGYHLYANGQVERLNQEYAQNSLTHSSVGFTPFQCVFGYQPSMFPWSGGPSEVPAVDDLVKRSEWVWDSAHVRLQRAVRAQRIKADWRRHTHSNYQPGQNV